MPDYGGTVNSSTYSGREFKVYIGSDNGVGTLNASTNGQHMYRLDIEGITLPTFSPNQEFEMRSGTGRVAEFGSMFSSSKGVTTEFSLSGRVTLQDLPILMENVLAQEGDSGAGNNKFEILTGYSPSTFKHGDSTGNTVFSKTLTVAFIAPTASDSYAIPGCVCTSLQLSADMGTASGRYDYSATFSSRYKPVKNTFSVSGSDYELSTTLGSTNMFLSDQSTKDLNVMDVAADVTLTSASYSSGDATITHASNTNVRVGQIVSSDGAGIPSGAYVASITSATEFELSANATGSASGRTLTLVSDFTSINPIFNSFSLTIESPSIGLGAQGTDAEPEVFARAVPEMNITIAGSLKYDTETDKLLEAHRDGAQTSFMQMLLSNVAVDNSFDNLATIAIDNISTQQFAVIVPKAKLISASVGSGDVATLDFEAKVTDPGSNKIIHIATGATA